MSSRVRIIAKHSIWGLTKGGRAIRVIEEWYKKQWEGYPLLTAEIKAMPHWKRILWMVKGNKDWKVKVFRENRRANSRKSLYGLELVKSGYQIIPLKKYGCRYQKDVNGNFKAAVRPHNWIQAEAAQLIMQQEYMQPVNPVQVVANNDRIFRAIPEPEEF